MNSRKHEGPSVGGATALAEKPAAKPPTRLHAAAQSGRTDVQSEPSSGIPWEELRRTHKLPSHTSHPRDGVT